MAAVLESVVPHAFDGDAFASLMGRLRDLSLVRLSSDVVTEFLQAVIANVRPSRCDSCGVLNRERGGKRNVFKVRDDTLLVSNFWNPRHHHRIPGQRIETVCAGDFEGPMLSPTVRWAEQVVVAWLALVVGAPLLGQWRERLAFHLYETFCSVRVGELFDIIVDFPDSGRSSAVRVGLGWVGVGKGGGGA